ncbi:hypothetical protein DL96DRAFT_1609150 [Flagelloscypha sp. PMI_526]|nr:hypothetical protein DL96DRAFT_1609150 [Flagelloscypha sp. PMI_526]
MLFKFSSLLGLLAIATITSAGKVPVLQSRQGVVCISGETCACDDNPAKICNCHPPGTWCEMDSFCAGIDDGGGCS